MDCGFGHSSLLTKQQSFPVELIGLSLSSELHSCKIPQLLDCNWGFFLSAERLGWRALGPRKGAATGLTLHYYPR